MILAALVARAFHLTAHRLSQITPGSVSLQFQPLDEWSPKNLVVLILILILYANIPVSGIGVSIDLGLMEDSQTYSTETHQPSAA